MFLLERRTDNGTLTVNGSVDDLDDFFRDKYKKFTY